MCGGMLSKGFETELKTEDSWTLYVNTAQTSNLEALNSSVREYVESWTNRRQRWAEQQCQARAEKG